jgi:hypothetical protein
MILSSRGPLLAGLVRTHQQAEAITSYPELSGYALALATRCEELGQPLVWPVGEPAQRVAGAAVLVSEGEVRVRGWVDCPQDKRILLVGVAAVSPIELLQAAGHARAMGAAEVHVCAVAVAGFDAPELEDVFDSRESLTGYLPAAA